MRSDAIRFPRGTDSARSSEVTPEAYALVMSGRGPVLTDLPEGIVYHRSGANRYEELGITPLTDAEIAAMPWREAAITDADAAIRHIRKHAGSIALGFTPCKSDYRARWRYNGEEFDET